MLPLALAGPLPAAISPPYRIDVAIAPFGFTIFSRKEAGYGSAKLTVRSQGGTRAASFEFGGASIPERARGIRQIGYFEVCAMGCLTGARSAIPEKTFLSILAEAALRTPDSLRSSYQYGDRVLEFRSLRRNISGQIVVEAEVQGKSRHRFSFTCAATGNPKLSNQIEHQPRYAVPNRQNSKEST